MWVCRLNLFCAFRKIWHLHQTRHAFTIFNMSPGRIIVLQVSVFWRKTSFIIFHHELLLSSLNDSAILQCGKESGQSRTVEQSIMLSRCQWVRFKGTHWEPSEKGWESHTHSQKPNKGPKAVKKTNSAITILNLQFFSWKRMDIWEGVLKMVSAQNFNYGKLHKYKNCEIFGLWNQYYSRKSILLIFVFWGAGIEQKVTWKKRRL